MTHGVCRRRDLATTAGAGDDVLKYLQLRGIRSVGTLAMLAPTEQEYRDQIIAPLLSGFGEIKPADNERPIVTAVLLYMRELAREARQQATPPSQTSAPFGECGSE